MDDNSAQVGSGSAGDNLVFTPSTPPEPVVNSDQSVSPPLPQTPISEPSAVPEPPPMPETPPVVEVPPAEPLPIVETPPVVEVPVEPPAVETPEPPIVPPVQSAPPSNKGKTILMVLIFLLLATGTTFGYFTFLKGGMGVSRKAAINSTTCSGPMEDTCGAEGYYIGYNWDEATQKQRAWGHYGFNPDDSNKCCANFGKKRQFYVEILRCKDDDATKCSYSDAVSRDGGACKTLTIADNGSGCGKGDVDWDFYVDCGRYQVDVCEGGTCANPKYGYQIYHACGAPSQTPVPPTNTPVPNPPTPTGTGIPTPTPTGTIVPSPTPTGTRTPTPTSTPPVNACLRMEIYRANSGDPSLNNLKPGETIHFRIASTGSYAQDQAAAVRLFKNGTTVGTFPCTFSDNGWHYEYVIPAGGYGNYEAYGFIKSQGVWR